MKEIPHLLGYLLLLGLWLAFIPNPLSQALFHNNQYTVIPGQIYRSAQPDIEDITRWSEQLRIRSVLTLQSATPWSPEQAGQIGSLGIDLFFVPLKFDRQPSRASMIKLLELIHNAPKPLLVHCLRGVDRSGLVSAMAQLANGKSATEALEQLSLSRGFLPFRQEEIFRTVIENYRDWLGREGLANSSEIFRDWIEHDYISGFYGASITPSSPITQIYLKKPLQFDAVIKNESPYTIPLSGNKSGVHFAAIIEKADGSWRREKRGEFIELDLTPGKSVELHMKLPRVPKPGDYSITLDLVEERVAWFHEMGSPAYQTNVAAR